MKQKSKRKKGSFPKHLKNNSSQKNTPPVTVNTPLKKSIWQRIKSLSKKTYAVLGVISLLIGYVLYYDSFNDLFKSKHEKFEEDHFIPGIFIPPQILTSYDKVLVEVGGICEAVTLQSLQQGHYVKPNPLQCKGTKETPFDLILYLENSRLYMHCVLKDIQKEEIVGVINFKHWSLFKPNLLNYYSTDTSLEVLDRGGNVIFDITYKYPNTLFNMNEEVLKATHQGSLKIGEFDIPAYNLPDKSRVLSRIGFLKALGRTGKAKGGRKYDDEFQTPIFLTANNLKPFISNELLENSKPVKFIDTDGVEA